MLKELLILLCLVPYVSSGWMARATVFATPGPQRAPASAAPAEHNRKVFEAVWKLIAEKYFDAQFNGVNWDHAGKTYRSQAAAATTERELYLVLNRMLTELHDRHTMAVSPTEVHRGKLSESLNPGFIGEVIEDRVVLTRIVRGSSAHQAGIQPGWILTHWNGVPVKASRPTNFTMEGGQTVVLRFLDAQDRERKVRMVAQPFTNAPEQTARLLDVGVLYIRFESFYVPTIGEWFAKTLAQYPQTRACIIDLRGNCGGLVKQLRECLRQLYARPAVFGDFIGRGGKDIQLSVPGQGEKAYPGAVVVLIDGESFSAAELFAAAIQDTGRGKVVGRRSSGSGLNSIQEQLPDGGILHLSIRDYHTRRGKRIEGHGIQPDEHVALKLADIRRNIDRDLERALQLVR